MKKITILTSIPPQRLRGKIKRFLYNPIVGHFGVMRSILRGLNKISVKFNYNVLFWHSIADVVYVPACLVTLKAMVILKRKGKIKKLIAGPNLVIKPDDDEVMGSPEIDIHIVNSSWTHELYGQVLPSIKSKLKIWPAGVDTDFWCNSTKEKNHVLIYIKHIENDYYYKVVKLIQKLNLKIIIIKYGSYTKKEYRRCLQVSKYAIFFTKTESQGLALAEAWSCNIPTLVFKISNITFPESDYVASSAPYLTQDTGRFFTSLNELENILRKDINKKYLKTFKPREWVLRNMSDEVCAKKLIDLIEASGA